MSNPADRARLRHAELVIILAVLSLIAPLAIDMYLPALPFIAQSLAATDAQAQLTLPTYFAGFAIGQAFYGPISDRFGRKPPLYFGMALYIAASLGCALAPDIDTLIALRFLQAAGGCAGTVVARAMVRDLFTGADAIRVFSRVLLVFGIGPILAPMVGSGVLIWFGWREIFFLLTAIGILSLVLIFIRLPESRDPAHVRPLRLSSIVIGYGRLLAHRNFMGYALTGGTMMAGTFAYIAGLPFVIVNIFGYPDYYFSLVFGGNAVGFILASQINVRAQRHYSPERVLLAALLIQIAAAAVFVFDVLAGIGGIFGILVPLFFWIATMGFVIPNTTAMAMAPFAANAGAASALLGVLQFVLAAGSSALLAKLTQYDNTALPMIGVMATFSVLSLLINRFVVKRPAKA
ncbi:multidrug effflux MFS transporter [Dongia sedimenti]|uniref:Bcr/CflA family efflux transporter n=1 Tax=Dongia sedimenti TaxID=3064282 RepID=A0ABU0YKB7_9PROT|nr:multidrug effflux MFS transporter [Rhodospirillaceae bacterium R-7]